MRFYAPIRRVNGQSAFFKTAAVLIISFMGMTSVKAADGLIVQTPSAQKCDEILRQAREHTKALIAQGARGATGLGSVASTPSAETQQTRLPVLEEIDIDVSMLRDQKKIQAPQLAKKESLVVPVSEQPVLSKVGAGAALVSPAPPAVTFVEPVRPIEPKKEALQDVSPVLPKRVDPPAPSQTLADFSERDAMPVNPVVDGAIKPDIMGTLGLQEAVTYALKNNHEIQAFDARKDSAFWDHAGAYAQYVPSIEFTVAQGAETSTPGSYNGPDGSRIDKTTHNRRDRSLFVRQPLIDLAVVADIVKTGKALTLTDMEKREMQETTAFGTVSAYLKLLQSQKAIELAEAYKVSLGGVLDRMQARLDGGGATAADLDRVKSRISVAEAKRLEALAEYGATLSEFKRLTKVVPAKLRAIEPLVPAMPPTLREAMEVALKMSPSYQASLQKVDLARGDRDKSIALPLPKVSLEYSNIYNYNAGGAAHGNPIDGVYPNQEDSRVMVVARWSLTGGTSLTSALSGSAKMREMSQKSLDARGRLEQGLSVAYDAVRSARRRKAVLMESYETDARSLAGLEEQFMQGERSLFEILDAQDRFFATKLDLMRTLYSEALAAYQIRLQMGEIAKAVLSEQARNNGGQ